jgi:hypothetical protein
VHPPELKGSFAKLARAKEHIAGLREAELDYFGATQATRPFEVDHHFDDATNVYSFVGRVTREPPLRMGAIVGDIAHNLRSALDYLVWELVASHSGGPEHLGWPYPQFPIYTDPKKWDPAGKKSPIRGVSPQAAERLKLVQPFNPNPTVLGPSPLLLLHHLWNRDKHRSITVVSGAVRGPDGLMYGRSPLSKDMRLVPVRDVAEIIDAESFWGIPIDGHPLVQATIRPSGPSPRVELEGKSIAGLLFDDRSSLNHGIADMGMVTEDILEEFARDWDQLA